MRLEFDPMSMRRSRLATLWMRRSSGCDTSAIGRRLWRPRRDSGAESAESGPEWSQNSRRSVRRATDVKNGKAVPKLHWGLCSIPRQHVRLGPTLFWLGQGGAPLGRIAQLELCPARGYGSSRGPFRGPRAP